MSMVRTLLVPISVDHKVLISMYFWADKSINDKETEKAIWQKSLVVSTFNISSLLKSS